MGSIVTKFIESEIDKTLYRYSLSKIARELFENRERQDRCQMRQS